MGGSGMMRKIFKAEEQQKQKSRQRDQTLDYKETAFDNSAGKNRIEKQKKNCL